MFFKSRKLTIEICRKASGVSLEEAIAGRAGKLFLGAEGVKLWTPNVDVDPSYEYVCDLRFDPLSKNTGECFKKATMGCFLPAYMVVFRGHSPHKIEQALEQFDYVIVPSDKIKNIPADFRKRVLGYRPLKGPQLIPEYLSE